MQTRMESLYEAGVNIVIGYAVNFAANFAILPLFGFYITFMQNLYMGLLFTVVSMARQYAIRRWFNGAAARLAKKLAGGS